MSPHISRCRGFRGARRGLLRLCARVAACGFAALGALVSARLAPGRPGLLSLRPARAEGGVATILRFDSDFDRGALETTDASAEVSGPGRLLIRTGTSARWPTVAIRAPGGKWDLGSKLYVLASVTLKSSEPAQVYCRVDNPGADGRANCVTGDVRLSPGDTATLRVPLAETPWRLPRDLGLVGMRAAPGPPGRLDPRNVTRILFFVSSPRTAHAFEVSDVIAGGAVSDLDPERFFPFVDEFGQFIHADWPGKVHSLEELRGGVEAEDRDLEAHPGPADRDRWGGWEGGPKLRATGFFRTEKLEGKWWLVDPDGRLFWSHGVDCVRAGNATPITDRERYFRDLPPEGSPLARFYGRAGWAPHGYYKDRSPYRTFDFGAANRFRKYGEDWERTFAERMHRRLRSWGMNTIGNWSDPAVYLLRRTPYVATISFSSRPIEGSEGYWGKFPDPFDPSFRAGLIRAIEAERGKSIGDPWCIGFFVHNELAWGDEISLALGALASPADQPAKKAFLEDLRARYGTVDALNSRWGTAHASWEALLASQEKPDPSKAREDLAACYTKIAERYFEVIRDELKRAAPEGLYLGCRFAWTNDRAARAAAKYCDVVSFNRYADSVEDLQLPDGLDRPVVIGEFHFGALDRGIFHTGLRPTGSQEERAARYAFYVEGALRNPLIVGTHWFQYQDQPTTGRGDGENYQIGLVTISDVPHPETIRAVRMVGRDLYPCRFEGVVFRDAFHAAPDAPWTWVRGDPKTRRTRGGLSIRTEPGGLMGPGGDAKNILLRPLDPRARAASVSVETQPASQFEQAGLILYRDDDNYAKLVREFVDGETCVVFVVETEGRPRVVAKVPAPPGTTRLAFNFTAGGVSALAWGDAGERASLGEAGERGLLGDARDRKLLGEAELPASLRATELPEGETRPSGRRTAGPLTRIGVFAQSGEPGADRWARFAEFTLYGRTLEGSPGSRP